MCGNPLKSVGNVIGSVLGLKTKTPAIAAAPAAPVMQDSKTPNVDATISQVQQEQNGMSGGIANTLLTGPTGITDDQLRLGRKTLLGG